jgi:hypothetical protein
MVKGDKESQIIEHGDIFFFYRPKVGTEEVEDIGDVQRFYMITSPEMVPVQERQRRITGRMFTDFS